MDVMINKESYGWLVRARGGQVKAMDCCCFLKWERPGYVGVGDERAVLAPSFPDIDLGASLLILYSSVDLEPVKAVGFGPFREVPGTDLPAPVAVGAYYRYF